MRHAGRPPRRFEQFWKLLASCLSAGVSSLLKENRPISPPEPTVMRKGRTLAEVGRGTVGSGIPRFRHSPADPARPSGGDAASTRACPGSSLEGAGVEHAAPECPGENE